MKIALLPAAAISAVTLSVFLQFGYAPTEALQGEVQRLFYLHVPAAWVAYLAFAIATLASVLVVARRAEWARWDALAVSSVELGVAFSSIVLVTGPVWGWRVWGTPWVWDARLTSTLVLWIIYAGYLVFRGLTPPGERRARLAAAIAIVGAIDIPLIHFSVQWWRTQHPLPAVLKPGRPDLPGSMLLTLLVSLMAYTLLFALLLSLRVSYERARTRVSELEETAGV